MHPYLVNCIGLFIGRRRRKKENKNCETTAEAGTELGWEAKLESMT